MFDMGDPLRYDTEGVLVGVVCPYFTSEDA